ncbi:hypothetical protein ACDZ29_04735 [Peribacillus sp. RS7]|uniref:hypothetical protein n=1 Tax=Peribacillus sp. RS7 TaxID=3242679 RepID=UPI0035C2301B
MLSYRLFLAKKLVAESFINFTVTFIYGLIRKSIRVTRWYGKSYLNNRLTKTCWQWAYQPALGAFYSTKAFYRMWASSPSIWWNDHEVLLHADCDHCIDQWLLITVGSEEGFIVEDAKFYMPC